MYVRALGRRFSKQFANNTEGSVSIIFGLSVLVLALAIALAFDSSRAVNVNTKLKSALDAAGLAAAKLLDDESKTDAQIKAVASKYFLAHSKLIKMNGLTMGAFSSVIDRAASSVKVSTTASLTSLFGSLAGMQENITLNPSSETVYKSKKIEISLVLDITGSMLINGRIDSLKTAAKDMIDVLYSTNPNPGAIRVALVPYSASVNAGSYKSAVAGSSGADDCVVERQGSDQLSNSGPSGGGYLGTSSVADNPNYSCALTSVMPLTDLADASARSALKSRIDSMSPAGNTSGHIGLAWGWYMLSDQWGKLWPKPQRPASKSTDIIKAVILMTDGDFNTSYGSQNRNLLDPSLAETSFNQALGLCSAITSGGAAAIQLFTVGFEAPIAAESLLKQCSGNDNFFDASDTGSLIESFREIAERLTNLRLSS
jgi:Flp pilus assembly protein TadG